MTAEKAVLCFDWRMCWPHTIPDPKVHRLTPVVAAVSCPACLHALGHQKYAPPRYPSGQVES